MTPTAPTGAARQDGLAAILVAIPAHDEQDGITGCLAAVRRATDRLKRSRPDCRVLVVVAPDACTDQTAGRAAAAGAILAPVRARCVGTARDAAVLRGLAQLDQDPRCTWVANTDADTLVPDAWLEVQAEAAERGADLVTGTVEPQADVPADVLAAWRARHELRDGHPHVHGANLGVRASAWQLLGGFGPRPVHEDVELVLRARAAGLRVVASDRHRARTSARFANRVEGGFAGYLRELSLPAPSPGGTPGTSPADPVAATSGTADQRPRACRETR